MELKKVKKCPMLNSGRIVSDVTSAERRGVFGDLQRRGKSMWVMRGFEFPLSLSLSLSLFQSWSSGLRVSFAFF